MSIDIHIANAFTDGGRGGNPAGVVIDADPLSPEQRLDVARRVGLSETAFVGKSALGDFKLEFFTPRRQIAQCGHATVATACVLRALGRLGRGRAAVETIDGIRDVSLDGDMAFLQQQAPRYEPIGRETALERRVLESLGIAASDLLDQAAPTVIDTGNAFVVLGVRTARQLGAIRPNPAAIEAITTELDAIGFYVFCLETSVGGRDAAARMFAPRYGIPEESATGMAAGPLACLLHDQLGRTSSTLLIEQGHFMAEPSPSLLTVQLDMDAGRIVGLKVGGTAQVMRTLHLERAV